MIQAESTMTITSSALSLPIFPVPSIEKVIGMSLRTMCFGSVYSGWSYSSKYIVSAGYRFKMIWIHAFAIPAKMVKGHSLWNRSSYQFIGNSMGKARRCLAVRPNAKQSVSRSIQASSPFPTVLRCLMIDLNPESFFQSSHKAIIQHKQELSQ